MHIKVKRKKNTISICLFRFLNRKKIARHLNTVGCKTLKSSIQRKLIMRVNKNGIYFFFLKKFSNTQLYSSKVEKNRFGRRYAINYSEKKIRQA